MKNMRLVSTLMLFLLLCGTGEEQSALAQSAPVRRYQVEALLRSWEDRATARKKILELESEASATRELISIGRSTRTTHLVRSRAIALLGSLSNPASLKGLALITMTGKPLYRCLAIQSLAEIGSRETLHLLIEKIDDHSICMTMTSTDPPEERDVSVSDEAVRALEKITGEPFGMLKSNDFQVEPSRAGSTQSSDLKAQIEGWLDSPQSIEVARQSLLSTATEAEIVDALGSLLDGPLHSWHRDAKGFLLLGTFKTKRSVQIASRLAQHSKPIYRCLAIISLGQIGTEEALSTLIGKLGDHGVCMQQAQTHSAHIEDIFVSDQAVTALESATGKSFDENPAGPMHHKATEPWRQWWKSRISSRPPDDHGVTVGALRHQ
jgi:HEAT repeat protein